MDTCTDEGWPFPVGESCRPLKLWRGVVGWVEVYAAKDGVNKKVGGDGKEDGRRRIRRVN